MLRIECLVFTVQGVFLGCRSQILGLGDFLMECLIRRIRRIRDYRPRFFGLGPVGAGSRGGGTPPKVPVVAVARSPRTKGLAWEG